jgi:hypothetical protein
MIDLICQRYATVVSFSEEDAVNALGEINHLFGETLKGFPINCHKS